MKNLKSIRTARRLTQQEVADAISIERVTYARYENGTRTPPIENVIKLARFFEVTTDYLLGLTDNPQGHEQPTTIAARPTARMEPISQERLDEIIAEAVAKIREEAANKENKPEQ